MGAGYFLLSQMCLPAVGPTHSAIDWAPGAVSPESKWPNCEIEHLPPYSAEHKREWSYSFAPAIWSPSPRHSTCGLDGPGVESWWG
jgi:hypothetical protein